MARLRSLFPILAYAAAWLVAAQAVAGPYVFTYGGRLANSSDVAVSGPVNLELKFYRSAAGGNPVGVSAMVFSGVPLEDGVFQVDVTQLAPAEMALVFDSTQDTYVEVTDHTNNVTYPRQHLSAMPYAMKVPVDGKTVVFDGNGNLSLAAGQPSANQFLTKDANGNLTWGSPASTSLGGQVVSTGTPTANQVLSFNGSQWVAATVPMGSGTVTAVTATAPLSVTSGSTTPQLALTQASSVSSGYLAVGDYVAFTNALGKSGGTMTGPISMGSNQLTNLATPSASTDAASKIYVDTADSAQLRKDGSVALTGPWNVGTQDLTNIGNMALATSKTLGLGVYASDPTGLSAPDKGKMWFNSTSAQIKYFDGTSTQALGAAGAGITSINSSTASSQTFNTGAAGTAPAVTDAGPIHTINIPLASAASVTAGLISNSDYAAFTNKQPSGSYINALTGDVVASGPGGATAVVASVGSSTAANVHSAELLANAATNNNNPTTLVKRDGSGNFSASTITANLIGNVTGNLSGTAVVAPANGGSGVANGSAAIFARSNYPLSLTLASSTALTLPTTGTLATLAGAETLTNKILTTPTLVSANISATTLTTTGNIGIGSASPLAALDIQTASMPAVVNLGSTTSASVQATTPNLALRNVSTTGNLTLQPGSSGVTQIMYAGGTQALVVTNNGSIGIGTASPAHTLEVAGTAANTAGGSWITISDIRMKTIEGDYEYGLDEIKKLHTVRFKYKEGNALNLPTDLEHTGFIAQEVQQVIPDAVILRPDGYLELNVDPIHWATVNAVQQLALENDRLKVSAAQLQADAAQLKATADKAESASAQLRTRVDKADAEIVRLKTEAAQLKVLVCSQFPTSAYCQK